jgi:uncharacterized protein (DUF952 family)
MDRNYSLSIAASSNLYVYTEGLLVTIILCVFLPSPLFGECRKTTAEERQGGAGVATIYKICDVAQWQEAQRAGVFRGAGIDARDGFIHFSTAQQVVETAAKHFAGIGDLMLIAVDTAALGAALKWEPSRGGALFPHLYGTLALGAVAWARPLPLGADGRHIFPNDVFRELAP